MFKFKNNNQIYQKHILNLSILIFVYFLFDKTFMDICDQVEWKNRDWIIKFEQGK